jgi:phytoene dehydrogenase-like protein
MGYLDEYDGIVLGAGHNGLIAQAYLARARLKILSIDRAQHAGERASILSRTALGRTYLDLLRLSPRQFVESAFQTPAVKAMLLYFCIIREVDVNVDGQGHLVPSYIASSRPGQIVRGGSYALARGLKHDIYAHGGHIMEQAEPRRILVKNGRAVGVELLDGRRIQADFVVSTLNPHQTFHRLLGGETISEELSGKAENYRYQSVGPRDAPRYRATETDPDVASTWLVFLGLDDPAAVYQLYADADAGRLSEQIMLIGGCPTQSDPTQAPSGYHAAFMWQKVPYHLHGDPLNWDHQKPGHIRTILDFWAQYAPNVRGDNLLNAFAGSPLDTERRYPNMARGDLMQGWVGPGQRGDRSADPWRQAVPRDRAGPPVSVWIEHAPWRKHHREPRIHRRRRDPR